MPETMTMKSNKRNDEKTITADVYINTLRDLAESISVSSLGKGATSVRYNYSRFHSSFEDSILDLVMHLLEKWILLVEGY